MNLSELLQELDSGVEYEKSVGCSDITTGATTCPECLSRQYFVRGAIDYSCKNKRDIYVLKYLPVHVAEIYRGLSALLPEISEVKFGSKISALCLGGGPGSDGVALQRLVGVNKDFFSGVENIGITRVDCEENWNEQATKVRKVERPKEFELSYHRMVGNACACKSLKKKYDFVILSYLISELSDGEALDLALSVRSILNDVAFVVVNDRPEDVVFRRAELFMGKINVKFLKKGGFNETHAGFSYPDALRQKVGAKLKMTSFYLSAKV